MRSHLIARLVTEATGPAVCALAALLVVAFGDRDRGASASWGGVAAIFVAVIPVAFVLQGVRKGRWSDHHVEERRARRAPLLAALTSAGVGLALLVASGAPRSLIALVATMSVGLAVVLAITRWWKVSIHCTVFGGLLGVLVVVYGAAALLGLLALTVVAWSRVVLGSHSWPQVVVGALLGAAMALLVFPILR